MLELTEGDRKRIVPFGPRSASFVRHFVVYGEGHRKVWARLLY